MGKYFYIKDGDTVWNPGWQPVKTDLDNYECRHGMGYSKFTGDKNDIKATLTTLFQLHDPVELTKSNTNKYRSVLRRNSTFLICRMVSMEC